MKKIFKLAKDFENKYVEHIKDEDEYEVTEEYMRSLEDEVRKSPEFQEWKKELLDPFPPNTNFKIKKWFNEQSQEYKDFMYKKYPTKTTSFYLAVSDDMKQEERFKSIKEYLKNNK